MRAPFIERILDLAGHPRGLARVFIYHRTEVGGRGDLATLYSAEFGAETLPNPLVGDKYGNAKCWLDVGPYVWLPTYSSYTGPLVPFNATGAGRPDAAYTHTQYPAASIWPVVHNLGKHPSITVVDSAGTVLWPSEEYVNENTLNVIHKSETAGKVYCN